MDTTFEHITWLPDNLSVKKLSISYGSQNLINNSDFQISKGDKIALLGRNGTGKSTLLNWFTLNHNIIPIPWLVYQVQQELSSSLANTPIINIVLASHKEKGIMWQRRNELELIDELTMEQLKEYNKICQTLDSMNADSDLAKASVILKGLGFTNDEMYNKLSTFSGGWRARVALSCGLFMSPDFLLLDEPSNHLDLDAVIWLTEFCKSYSSILLIITHNIDFAHTVCNTIFHIDNKRLKVYKCSYNRFVKLKEQEKLKNEKEWNRMTKEISILKKDQRNKKQIESIIKKADENNVREPEKTYRPKFIFRNTPIYKSSSSLIDVSNISVGYSDKIILRNITFALFPLSKIVLVGSNGSGKSTFMKLLKGALDPIYDDNGYFRKKNNLKISYFDQHFYNDLSIDVTPVEYLLNTCDDAQYCKKILGTCGISGTLFNKKLDVLSGGQKFRVYFSKIILEEPDILCLDEITNHLDMESIEGLTTALKEFPGSIITISHDLNFLEDICTEVWQIANGTITKLGNDADGIDLYVKSVINKMNCN